MIGLIHAQSTTKVRGLIVKTPKGLMGPILRREALKLLWSLFWYYNRYSETVPKVLFDFTVDPSLCKLFIVYCNVLIGAFMSIFPKPTQSAAGLKALKSAANGRYWMCKSLPCYFTFTVQKYMYPPVSKVNAGYFRVSIIHRTLAWTTGSLMCVGDRSW